jgi:hypothetical protein
LIGVDACFFAASASKDGGNPTEVDKIGLINTAEACIENKVPRLVINYFHEYDEIMIHDTHVPTGGHFFWSGDEAAISCVHFS